MKGRTICLDHLAGREAAALIVDGRLEDFLVAGDDPAPGTVFVGIVERPMKGQGGVFVTLPEGRRGFLRQIKGVGAGKPLLVQVSGHAEHGKAIPLATRLLFKSRYAIVTPDAPGINVSRQVRDTERAAELKALGERLMAGSEMGLILRSAAARADADEIAEDIQAMRDQAERVLAAPLEGPALLQPGDGPHLLAWREWTDAAEIDRFDGSFARHGVLEALDDLKEPYVALGQGGMWIEPTRALVAVDIDTGGAAGQAAGLKANISAMRDLPRQLRLRGLGGQIVIDPAPMSKRDRPAFEAALKAALKRDTVETLPVGWTPLGHYELQRKRERWPVAAVLRSGS